MALVNGLVGKGFLVVAVYLQDGAMLGGRNASLHRLLAGMLNGCGMRRVCAGDWNIPPEVLASSGFLNLGKGRVVAAGTPTCVGGAFRSRSRAMLAVLLCAITLDRPRIGQ